ncbi:MAG: BrnA antitoxin family protein [Nitrospinae bacterium]|nr:BrnA antitoxin family protein [Nitrospinota bacterium]
MKSLRKSGKSATDWTRAKTVKDRDIDFSDSPEITPEMFARAAVRNGLQPPVRKKQLTLRLDADVLNWFKAQGRGYQTRINALLRAYKNAHGKRA